MVGLNFREYWIRLRNILFRTNNTRELWIQILLAVFTSLLLVSYYQASNFPPDSTFTPTTIMIFALLPLLIFILFRQYSFYYWSKQANEILGKPHSTHQTIIAASYFSRTGQNEKAAALLFHKLVGTQESDWYYKGLLNDYFKNVEHLPNIKQMQRLSSDALLVPNEKLLLFLDVFVEFVIVKSDAKWSDEHNNLLTHYKEIRDSPELYDPERPNVMLILTDAILTSNEAKWDEVFSKLDLIKSSRWVDIRRVGKLYNFLARNAYQNENPECFIRLYGYRANLQWFTVFTYDSIASLVHKRWGEDGLIRYMKYIDNLPNLQSRRYAPKFKILTDVIEITEDKKLHSFIISNLRLILGFVNDGIWTPSFTLRSIITNFSKDTNFMKELLENAMDLLETYPEIGQIIASQAKLQGIILDSDEKYYESVHFFEIAVQAGMTLQDKTIATTSLTYIVDYYLKEYRKTSDPKKIEYVMELLKDDDEQCAILLSNVIVETHSLGLHTERDDFLERFNQLHNIPPFANGNVLFVKARIALDDDQLAIAKSHFDQAAQSYFSDEKFKLAGMGWLQAGSLSWSLGNLEDLKEFYEKSLLAFQKTDEFWRQATVLAGLNKWSEIDQVLVKRLEKIDQTLGEFESRSHLWKGKSILKRIEHRKSNLSFEKSVIEIVQKACRGIDEWTHGNYQSCLRTLSESKYFLEKQSVSKLHPSASFIFVLTVVLGYYISRGRIFIARNRREYTKAHKEVELLIQKLEQEVRSLAAIHEPLLKVTLEIAYVEQRVTNYLDTSNIDERRERSRTLAIEDYGRIQSDYRKMGMLEDVARIDRTLKDLKSRVETPDSYDTSIRTPISFKIIQQESVERVEIDSSEESIPTVLSLLLQTGHDMERSAKDNFELKETHYRNALLNVLRSHSFQATKETYSVAGYTDIFIDFPDVPFIIECKVWSGQAKYKESIDQTFKYVNHRNKEAIIVTFSRNQKFTSVLHSAKDAILSHSKFVDESWNLEQSDSAYTTSVHTYPTDSEIKVKIHHMLFNLYYLQDDM